jgi:hypothetical protein
MARPPFGRFETVVDSSRAVTSARLLPHSLLLREKVFAEVQERGIAGDVADANWSVGD